MSPQCPPGLAQRPGPRCQGRLSFTHRPEEPFVKRRPGGWTSHSSCMGPDESPRGEGGGQGSTEPPPTHPPRPRHLSRLQLPGTLPPLCGGPVGAHCPLAFAKGGSRWKHVGGPVGLAALPLALKPSSSYREAEPSQERRVWVFRPFEV